MALIGFIVAAISLIGVWYWRIKMLRSAATDLTDVAGDVQAAYRRYGFRKQMAGHPAETVTDPRIAATAMLVATAKLDGALTEAQVETITRMAREGFEVSDPEARDMTAYARWVADQSNDPDDTVRRLTNLVRDAAPPEAHRDLIARMRRVAEVHGGGVSDPQEIMIRRLVDKLGLPRNS